MRDIFDAKVAKWGPRTAPRYAAADTDLAPWIMEQTKFLPADAPMSERIWCIQNSLTERPTCKNGSTMPFSSMVNGYKPYCGRRADCACFSSDQSVLMKDLRSTKLAGNTWKNTVSAESRKKGFETTKERHGGIGYGSQSIRDKATQTLIERYGVDHFAKSDEAPRNDMSVARAGFIDRFGANPLVIFRDKAKKTMLEKYGVENPQQSESIKEKTRKTNMERYGAPTPFRSRALIDKGIATRRNTLIGPEAIAFFDSDERVMEAIDSGMGPTEASIKYGVSYTTALRAFARRGYENNKKSYEESQFVAWIRDLGFEVERNMRVLTPDLFEKDPPKGALELDAIVRERDIAFEFCGLFPHSMDGSAAMGTPKNRDYHLRKLEAANKLGLRLVTVFSDEWIRNEEATKSRIAHILGKSDRGQPARKCRIERVRFGVVSKFIARWHLQGCGPRARICYAAFDPEGALVGAMTFSATGRIAVGSGKSKVPELLRFCTDGASHPGLASKIFSAFLREENPEAVVSYADRRWSEGKIYEALGFSLEGKSAPGYFYTSDYSTRIHRFGLRKDVLVRMGGDPSKTERQMAQDLGYDRIYDCGQLKYVWTRF